MLVWTCRPWRELAVCAVLASAGCGAEDPVAGADLTPQESAALAAALADADAIQVLGPAALFASFVFSPIQRIGAFGSGGAQAAVNREISASLTGVRASSYGGAVGLQVVYDVNALGEVSPGTFTGVFGWNGLHVSTGTVEEAVSAAAAEWGSTTPAGVGTTQLSPLLGGAYGLGTYWNNSTRSAYSSTSGTLRLTALTFGGAWRDCSRSAQGITSTCSFQLGTMSGSFAFNAVRNAGTGPGTYTQSTIVFANLPAMKMTLAITEAR